jgi:hypothetical protein
VFIQMRCRGDENMMPSFTHDKNDRLSMRARPARSVAVALLMGMGLFACVENPERERVASSAVASGAFTYAGYVPHPVYGVPVFVMHTHPGNSWMGYDVRPSSQDIRFAGFERGIPEAVMSHHGTYYLLPRDRGEY